MAEIRPGVLTESMAECDLIPLSQKIAINAPGHGARGEDASGDRRVSDVEKYHYATGNHQPFIWFGVLSGLLLIAGLCRFAWNETLLLVAAPFVFLNGLYLLLSCTVMVVGPRFRLEAHQQQAQRYSNAPELLRKTRIDLFLPVCGESPGTLIATWQGVRELAWPGVLNISVLDDSENDGLRALAEQYGFHYHRRTDRNFRKAGNLRTAFATTTGDFILILDADFRPRPELLMELVPYLLEDDRLALVQSPQYFDVQPQMNWVQAGAGFVQELFYRIIQPARDRFGAAVCVGSCAIYRREALAEFGGTPEIDHSEDLWTGFELLQRGWRMKYVPVVLAKGLCPDRLSHFFSQQYRWCRGSLTLVSSSRFWTSRLTVMQKCCYASGFAYYLVTALNTVLTPLPPLIMVAMFPDDVHWNHLAYSILALIYTPFLIAWWSVYPFGLHFLTTREISGAAHLNALIDTVIGRTQDWVVTHGAATQSVRPRAKWAIQCLLVSSTLSAMAIWVFACWNVQAVPDRWLHFLPPLLFSTSHLAICWRVLHGVSLNQARPVARWWTSFVSSGQTLHFGKLLTGLATATLLLCLSAVTWFPRDHFLTDRKRAYQHHFDIRSDADFGQYRVADAFPELPVRRIIRMREHPQHPGVYYLADFTGLIHEVSSHHGRWQMRTVADLTGSDLAFLNSFAIHPQYPRDPRFFLTYRTRADDRPLSMRVTSLAVHNGETATHRDEELLIEQQLESEEHLGGDLAFDRQGCLLISTGDNQLSLQDKRSQRLDGGLFSGILRIDVDQRGGSFSHAPTRQPEQAWTENYFIPNDNPFVNRPDTLGEFWAIGLRNPFRISIDAQSDQLWIGEVGQDHLEQVELSSAGSNHQWSFQEGSQVFTNSSLQGIPPDPLFGTSTAPVHEYPHEDLNHCIVGGVVYRGSRFPELQGRYIFGDNRSGRIWSIDPAAPEQRELLLQLPFGKSASTLVSISTDQQGELFFTSFSSVPAVYRMEPTRPAAFPKTLSETGLFSSLTPLTPANGISPYNIVSPLWSDGLMKQRWIKLPPGKTIDNRGPIWKFPPGTLLIKHFAQGPDFSVPGQGVETRILVMREDGTTYGATYLWNPEQTEAMLQQERIDLSLTAGNESFPYHVPDFRDCRVCHHRNRPVLGFSEEQLNVPPLDRESGNPLLTLSRNGLFEVPYTPEGLSSKKTLTPLADTSASVEDRARSYLHANCSFCHHRDGLEHVELDLELFSSSGVGTFLGTESKLGYHPVNGRQTKFLIAPGDIGNSAIYQRMLTDQPQFSMPYLGRTRPHHEAISVIVEWIESLNPNTTPEHEEIAFP